MATLAELETLVANCRDDLHTEVKGWLDFTSNEHKDIFAKAILSIANHGIGFVVVGFSRIRQGDTSAS